MKMTCAISQQQAEKLYKNVYKSLSESLKSTDKIFDADKYMENLFNSIADKKDEDTAIKFLQQVPSIIRVIASKPAFDDLDLKLDPIKDLGKSFKNIDKGFDNVLKHFKPQMTQRSKMALLRANQIEAENAKEVDPPADGMETVRLRVSDALTSTMSQLIPVNPTKKQGLIEEKIDTGKQRIYTALERIAEKVSTNENAEITETITYQDVKLKLKPILLSKLAETHKDQLDTETRINLLERSKAINDKGLTPEGVDTINTIALVLTDADGIYQYFDAEGNITTKEKGGGIVYQFLRQTRKNFGKFEVVNAYGIAGVTQTPQEIAAITGESVEEVTKKQQTEFAQLDALRESAKKGEAPLLNFTGLSAGVKESIGQKTITLQNLREFAFVNNATFRSIRPVMTPGQNTSAVIMLNGKEYPLDRPNLPVDNVKGVRTPGDLIKKIAAVLANPKISNEKKHSFVNQFLSDNASSATRRHKINYHGGTNVLLFSYTEKTLEEGSGKTFAFTNEELNGKESIFEEVLTNAAKDKYGNFYSAKMSYPEEVLGKNGYEDYNLETGEIATELSPYLPLLETLPNAKIKISQQTDPGFFNSYMKFSLPSDFVTQLDNALNEPEVELNEEPISDLAYNVFVETNFVSDKILNDIADAYLKGEPLSLRQQAIFMATTANMEKIFAERKKVDFTTTDTEADIERRRRDGVLGVIPIDDEFVIYPEQFDQFNRDGDEAPKGSLSGKDIEYNIQQAINDEIEYSKNITGSRQVSDSIYGKGKIPKLQKVLADVQAINAKYDAELAALGNAKVIDQKISIDNIVDPKNTNNPSKGGLSSLFELDRKGVDLGKITQQDIDSAQEWWSNSPLAKYIDFKTMVNIVNSDVYAKFIAYGSKLNEKFGKIEIGSRGTLVDVYHEAWHAFSQIFLTPAQRTQLYNEVAKQKGTFTLLDGTTVKFSEASYLQLEEYLAEDFRTYGIDQAVKKGSPVRNSIFRRIANFLKQLFTKKSTKETLFKNLYFADKNKNFLNKYSPVVDTFSFNVLNRGIGSIENAEVEVLSKQDSNTISKSIDSYISDIVDNIGKEQGNSSPTLRLFIGETNRNALYDLVRQDFEEKLGDAQTKYNAIKEDPAEIIEAEKLDNKIRIFKAALENFGDAKKGVIKYHLENSTFNVLAQKFVEVDEEVDEELDKDGTPILSNEESVPNDFDKKVGKQSLLDLASKETLYILKSLHKLENGSHVLDELGYKELADFSTTWNNLMRAVSGEKNLLLILEKIKEASQETYPEFKQLLESKLPKAKSIANIYDLKTSTNFWQDVQRTRVTYLQTTIFENNVAEVTKASIETLSILKKFEAKFKSDLNNKHIERSTDNNIAFLNLKKVVEDFGINGVLNASKSYDFARAIGLYLDDLTVIKSELNKNQKAKEKYGLPFIYKNLFDMNTLNESANTSPKVRDAITDFRMNPIVSLSKGIEAGVLDTKEVNQRSTINNIISLQALYGADSANFAVLNAERNLVFEHIDDHTASMITYAINNAKKMTDLWTKGSEFEFMSYLNPEINSFTKRLQTLSNIFDFRDNFTKREGKSLQLFINSGTQVEVEDGGTNTTSLDANGKFLQEMNSMLKGGLIEFIRHASKQASFGMRVNGGINEGIDRGKKDPRLWVNIDKFAIGTADDYAIKTHMIPYLAGELERINKFRSNPELFKNYKGYNRPMADGTVAGENFTAFDNVLTKETKQDILDAVTDPNIRLEDYLKTDPELKRKIEVDITSYFSQLTNDSVGFYEQAKYLSPDLVDNLKIYNMSTEETERALIKAYTVNAWIQNFETATLVYGDIAQYNHEKEELHKRNTGSTSGGLKFRVDDAIKSFLNKLNSKVSYAATIPGMETLIYTGKFNTAIVQELKRDSKYIDQIREGLTKDYTEKLSKVLPADKVQAAVKMRVAAESSKYLQMEEGDGQGWITFDAYRALKQASGQWSDLQEDLFKKIIKNIPVSKADIVEMFPVYKLQNYGHLANTMIPVMAMHKFALAPLIPSMVKGSNLESLHNQMMKKNIQYVTFQSGSKVGSVTSNGSADEIYEANSDNKTLKEDIKFTPNTIYLEYLKDVTKVPATYKGKTVFATQLRKIILSNLYADGEIINKDNVTAIKAYEKAVDDYGDLLKLELLNEINYEYNPETGKYTGNFENFLKLIQKELTRKDVAEHHIEFINMNLDNTLKTDLSLHLKSDDIEKILVSLIEKRLVRQKIKGEALVQVSSAMTNGMWGTSTKFEAGNEESVRKFMGTNNLPFYNYSKDGTSAMKVAISLQGDFVNLLNLNYKGAKIGTRARLNEAIKDEEWLNEGTNRKAVTLTAVRIPVQGLNSMEFMEVHEFLDESAGNLIIPPTEIVAKSGADFDVDKLTTFMPALDKFGKFIESGLSNEGLKNILKQNKGTAEGTALNERVIVQQKAALENRLITTINDILKLPSNYASLIRPNATYLLKDEIADKLEDKVTDYNRFQNYHSEEQRVGKKTKRAISPTRTLEPLYNIHKHEANMVGKSVLGLVALFNALHPVFNSLGAAMPKTYKYSEYDFNLGQMVERTKDLDSKLFLPHNKTKDGKISLSGIQTQDGDLISELYSQLINGTVDVEKDAWIFFIQGNMELSPMLLMLLKAGVPAGHAIKFLSQPLIREYAKQQRLLGGSYANLVEGADTSKMYVKDKAAVKVLTEFGVKNPIAFVKNKYTTAERFEKKNGILNKDGHFDIQILDKILDEPENKSFDDHSLAIFMHFLELENQFSGFQDVIRLANPDTKTSKSIQEVIKRNVALDDLVNNSKIDPALVKGLREESILNTFYDNKIISDLVEPLFKLKDNKFVTKSIIDLVKSKKSAITKAFGKGEDGVSLFMTQFKNGMVNSIFQNYMRNYVNSGNDVLDIPTELLSKYFTDNVFFTESDVSYADDLMALIEKHSGLKDKYSVLQQIASPILKGGEKVLSLNNQKLLVKGNYTEQYYENIKQLADVNVKKVEDTVENKYISDMFKVLPLISLYQNGVGYSKYGFNEILPYEDFVTIMDKASNDFMKTSLNTETMMELFDIVSDPSTRNFKNYLSMTKPFVAQKVIETMKGVQEVFESNPALANQVYEAMGFVKSNTRQVIIQVPTTLNNYSTTVDVFDENKNKIGVVVIQKRGDEWVSLHPKLTTKGYGESLYSKISEYYTIVESAESKSGQGNKLWEKLRKKGVVDDGITGSISPNGDPIIQGVIKTGTFKLNNQITPQQKQQAQQLYSQYLDTIFPDSKVKDIVYHQASGKLEGEKFDKNKSAYFTDYIYFAYNINHAKEYYTGEGDILYRAIVNLKNPIIFEDKTFNSKDKALESLDKNYDGMINKAGDYTDRPSKEVIVREPEQIHILGSKQDIKGFKDFVLSKPTTQPSTSVKSNMVNDSIKDTQLDLFNQTSLTFGGKSINEQLQIMNTPEFKSFFAEETIKNPNLDASEALDYYIKCKGL
jgi:hypothetical protein